jgi:hypothetical protein
LLKNRIVLSIMAGLLAFGIGFTIFYLRSDSSRRMTFEECKNAGGTAWAVDLYDPDICSACAAYAACQEENQGSSDLREACPQTVACTECIDASFPYPDRCPDGLKKVGEISDAAIWFQCCR